MPTFQQVCGHKECAVFDLCSTSAARHVRGPITVVKLSNNRTHQKVVKAVTN